MPVKSWQFFSAWQIVRRSVNEEPEWWTTYLLGQHHAIYATKTQPRVKGIVLRLLRYAQLTTFSAIRHPRTKPAESDPVEVLVYAGTHNQKVSLNPIVQGLEHRDVSVTCISSHEESGSYTLDRWKTVAVGGAATYSGLFLNILRFRTIYKVLRQKDTQLIHKSIDSFLRVHLWSFYFFFLIRRIRPKLVIMSNDHNIENRTLLNICRVLDIRTAYVQHASVSGRFPALRFDYSFLDGSAARAIYDGCENNRCDTASLPDERHIFLTGVQKHLGDRSKDSGIGVAVKHKNDITAIRDVLRQISASDHAVVLRWHPGAAPAEITRLESLADEFSGLNFSDPREESVSGFASRIGCLVAGNTGIHLETSICGVPSIYYVIEDDGAFDYHGFVAQGLSINAPDEQALASLLADISGLKINADAVRAYSATFRTEWQDREGELVSSHIKALLEGARAEDLWGYDGKMGTCVSPVDGYESCVS